MHCNAEFRKSEVVAPICRFLFGKSALFELANSCAPWWAIAIATLLHLRTYILIIICPALPTILLILPANPAEGCAKMEIPLTVEEHMTSACTLWLRVEVQRLL